jgi:thiol-disulfide isomerase/thioredoxin
MMMRLSLFASALCVSHTIAFVSIIAKPMTQQQQPSLVRHQLYVDDNTGTPPCPTRRRRVVVQNKEYLHQVFNPQEFDQQVMEEHDSKLVVVRFISPYCKACQSIQVAYERLAKSLQSNKNVKFVDVYIKDRSEFPQLSIPATPYAQIYYLPKEVGLVEHAPIARRHLSTFRQVLKTYVDGVMDLPDEFFTDPTHYEPPRMVGLQDAATIE